MARFKGAHQETFVVQAPIAAVKARFGSLEAIAATYGNLERWSKVDDQTLLLVFRPKKGKEGSFQGKHQCRFVFTSPDVLEWNTVGTGNTLWSVGSARFSMESADRTRVDWYDRVEIEMPVNALIGRLIGPIASRQIQVSVARYLENLRTSLQSQKP